MDTRSTLEKARARLAKRISVAGSRDSLRVDWEIPGEWSWFLDQEETRTRCRRLRDRDDIINMIVPDCPLLKAGAVTRCHHSEEALQLWEENWGLAVFVTKAVSHSEPVTLPDHIHDVNKKIFVVVGEGLLTINDHPYDLYSQEIFLVQAGDVHSIRLHHPTKMITAFQTLGGGISFGK